MSWQAGRAVRVLAGALALFLLLAFLIPASAVRAAMRSVTSLADDGSAGTLRAVIAAAASGDTIIFSVTGKITLNSTSGRLLINKTLTITGPGLSALAVDGGSTTFTNGVSVFDIESGTVTISDLTIQNGNATGVTNGSGGVMINGGTAQLTRVRVSFNTADDLNTNIAGGIGVLGGTLTLADSTVEANEGSYAGGIYTATTTTVTGSAIIGNNGGPNGPSSGGINNGSTLSVTNSTISNNTAAFNGGGIANQTFAPNTATLTLANDTISNNTAGSNALFGPASGGGVYTNAGSTATIANTIIAGDTDTNANPDVSGAFTSTGHNLIGKTNGGTGWIATDKTGTVSSPLDPRLAPLQVNAPGTTATQALFAGSPALDQIPSAGGCGVGVTVDQRGVARPQPAGGLCDIGAYELQPPPNPLPNHQPSGPSLGNPAPLPNPPQPVGVPAQGGPPAPLPPRRP